MRFYNNYCLRASHRSMETPAPCQNCRNIVFILRSIATENVSRARGWRSRPLFSHPLGTHCCQGGLFPPRARGWTRLTRKQAAGSIRPPIPPRVILRFTAKHCDLYFTIFPFYWRSALGCSKHLHRLKLALQRRRRRERAGIKRALSSLPRTCKHPHGLGSLH